MYNDIKAAQEAKLDLITRVQSIDAQLSERAAEMTDVEDDKYKEYLEWKARACKAKANLILKLRRTKLWLAQTREEESKKRLEEREEHTELLAELYALIKELIAEGATINEDEQLLLDDIGNYLERN